MSRIIVKNIPKEVNELELKNHFSKKGVITDVKILRKENGESKRFAFIGFKTSEQTKDSIKYFNNTYMKTCRLLVEEAKVQGDPSLAKYASFSKGKGAKNSETVEDPDVKESKEKKIKQLLELAKSMSNKNKFDAVGEKMREKETKENEQNSDETKVKSEDVTKIDVETINPTEPEKRINPKRLYLRNLAFEVTEEDIRNTFEKFGELTELHIPINRKSNQSFGYAYIAYQTVESAVLAISAIDRTIFQGRILHITPAMEKEEKGPRVVQTYSENYNSEQPHISGQYKKEKNI